MEAIYQSNMTVPPLRRMQSDTDILQRIHEAFAGCRRPEHFTNYTHCDECAEYDEVLRSRDTRTLCIEDVGNPGSDPICFISPKGFAYYFPALARLALALALAEPDPVQGWYGNQLFSHLSSDGANNERLLAFTPEQRRIVVDLLHHIAETRASLVDNELLADDLFWAIRIWSDKAAMP
ncbi:MAG TPA: hypothetical protein PLA50_13720 [Bacteroidia bacterium]|nr:hypothetical protein [Bacteroidia bacterium]